MTDLLSDLATPSDAELISSVRGGDGAAYGELFSRHRDAANRLARQLVRGPDADDLVSEAFAKVLSVLQSGGGPDVAFRAYLLTAVRRLHVDRMRAGAKVQTSDDMEAFDPGVPFHDTAIANFESGAAARAFATLPERWQLVLWHLEVEGNKPADIAPLLGMSANSVSALAYRAREGLRQAFLTMHLNDISDTDCRWVNEHLGAYVRKGLSNRDSTKVQAHLDQCRRCTAMYLELTEVNSNLAAIIAPLLLGAAATGYLAAAGGASVGGLGLVAALGRVRDAVAANAGAATVGGVAATVVAATTVGALMLPNSPERVTAANEPTGRTTAAAPTPAAPESAPESAPQRTERPAERKAVVEPVALPSDEPTTAVPTPSELPSESPAVPTEPAADQAVPGEQPGAETAGDAAFAAPVSFDGERVSFTISGEQLPSTLLLTLSSDPAGVVFAGDGGACRLTSDTEASCVTAALARGSTFQRASTSSAREFSDTLPLRVPDDQPETDVTLRITIPGGAEIDTDPRRSSSFQVTGKGVGSTPTATSAPDPTPTAVVPPPEVPVDPTPVDPTPVAPTPTEPTPTEPTPTEPTPTEPVVLTADVSLVELAPEGITPAPDGLYRFDATVRGAAGLPYVDLAIGGGASFAPESECYDSSSRLRCEAPEDEDLTLSLVVRADTVPATVTLSVAPPPEYDETGHTSDNARTVTLLAPEADASVSADVEMQGNSGKGTVTATVSVDPDTTVRLVISYNPEEVDVELPAGCDETPTGAVCELPGDASIVLPIELVDRTGHETSTATISFETVVPDHDDPNPSNNKAEVTAERDFS